MKYVIQVVTVKKSIIEVMDKHKLNRANTAIACGINRLTLRYASKIGSCVSIQTAKAITNFFNIEFKHYFEVSTEETKYAKSTNSGIRTILVVILGEAKRQGLIQHNYASSEFVRPISQGFTKQKEIFNKEEVKEFIQAVDLETNLKKKTIFSLLIFLGLRKSEVCGLSWEDIDFSEKVVSIRNNSIYFKKYGIITKGTKTEKSKRTISIPEKLLEILKEYNNWYNAQKTIYGDLWSKTNRLFLQDNGNPLNPCTVNMWLKKFNLFNGFKQITPHALRHTCITMQISAGVPLKTVSARAGHSCERITLDIYTHSLKEQDQIAAETYNNYLMQ